MPRRARVDHDVAESDAARSSSTLPVCPICRHAYPPAEMTKHHLVPRSRKGKETVQLCRHCHRQVHALYSEKELERSFGTLDKLLSAEDMQPWIAWIRRRRPTARLPARSSHQKGRRR